MRVAGRSAVHVQVQCSGVMMNQLKGRWCSGVDKRR